MNFTRRRLTVSAGRMRGIARAGGSLTDIHVCACNIAFYQFFRGDSDPSTIRIFALMARSLLAVTVRTRMQVVPAGGMDRAIVSAQVEVPSPPTSPPSPLPSGRRVAVSGSDAGMRCGIRGAHSINIAILSFGKFLIETVKYLKRLSRDVTVCCHEPEWRSRGAGKSQWNCWRESSSVGARRTAVGDALQASTQMKKPFERRPRRLLTRLMTSGSTISGCYESERVGTGPFRIPLPRRRQPSSRSSDRQNIILVLDSAVGARPPLSRHEWVPRTARNNVGPMPVSITQPPINLSRDGTSRFVVRERSDHGGGDERRATLLYRTGDQYHDLFIRISLEVVLRMEYKSKTDRGTSQDIVYI